MCSCPKSCPVETLKVKRLSTIKFSKHDSLILTFDLRSLNSKSRPRPVPGETRTTEFNICRFRSLSDRGANGDSYIHLGTRSKDLRLCEISVLNAKKFLRRLLQAYRVNAAIIHFSEGNMKFLHPDSRTSNRLAEPTRICCVTRSCIYLFRCLRHFAFFFWRSSRSRKLDRIEMG